MILITGVGKDIYLIAQPQRAALEFYFNQRIGDRDMKYKYISRVDSSKSNMYGYLIRLYKGKGVLFQKWVADHLHGGKENALKVAIEIRDTKIKELNYHPGNGMTNREWRPVALERGAHSNTGHLGVYESREYKKLKDGTVKTCHYIAASYVEERGKSKTKKFYYGNRRTKEQAIEEAVKFRAAKEISARAAAVEYNRALQRRMIEAENKLLGTNKHKRRSKNKSPLDVLD